MSHVEQEKEIVLAMIKVYCPITAIKHLFQK